MIAWLIDYIKRLIADKFTGNIQINFFKGGISNINKNESIKPEPDNKVGGHEENLLR